MYNFYNSPSSVPGAGNSFADWAALVAARDASALTVGENYVVRAPVCTGGAHGTRWTWTGSQIAPAGQQLILSSAIEVLGAGGGITTEEIIRQSLISADVLRGCRRIFILARGEYSFQGDPNARNVRIRLGAAGTVADAAICTLSIPGSNRYHSFPLVFAFVGNTTASLLGGTLVSAASSFHAQQTATIGSTSGLGISVPAGANNPLYLSITNQHGASPVTNYVSFNWHVEVA